MCKKLIYLTCFVLVLSLAGSASAQLMVYYKLDETSGTTAFDSSGKGNDGIVGGDPNWVIGYLDGGLRFSENDDANGITIPALNLGMRSDTGSVAFWMNLANLGTGINTIWWGGDNTTGGGMGPENEMHIHVEIPVANVWQGGELCFRVLHGTPSMIHLHSDPNKADATNPGAVPVSPILVNDSNWHHVVGTWGDDNGNVNLYLDGVLLQQAAFTTPSYPLTNMFLGRMAGGGRVYNGILDEVQIYGRAITEQEIRDIIAGAPALSLQASLPEPSNKAIDVPPDADLKWMGGDTAVKHNVYFGTVFEDINAASVDDPRGVLVSKEQEASTYILNTLDWDKTYYWRVDGIEADGTTIYKGAVWSFTVCNFLIVDDFEDYDATNNMLYNTWSDCFVNNTGMTVGSIDPPYVEQKIIRSGKQSMPLRYDNDGTVNEGTTLQQSGTLLYSEAERKWLTPQNWTIEDVNLLSLWFRGYPAYVGGFVEQPTGTYTVKSTGVDIWGNADEFHFAYKEVSSGACSIVAKVESIENANEWSKAGIMIRDSLEPGSTNVALFITPTFDYGVRYQFRNTTDGTTDREFDPNFVAPYWFRLERTSGGLVRAYHGPDGVQWTQFTLRAVSMTMPIYIGLAVTSHDAALTAEGVFSNVSFPNNAALTSQPWSDRDIGIMSNENEPMYMVVNGNAVVYNNDPNAALINQWTEWEIDLKRFTNLGVNLTRVSSLGIGLGNRANPQSGGTGTLYIDDIRLYRP
ncbi:MAG: LamG domain-containing protein [Phycisphaerae bacterium]